MSDNYIVGVDIGGTFTDCVAVSGEGSMTLGKASSTPRNFALGVIDAVRDAARNLGMEDERGLLSATRLFYHACTIGDNTLITRSGARTGLIATAGFGDTILMMRGGVVAGLSESEAHHMAALTKPDPLVPKRRIAEVNERVDFEGDVLVGLDEAEAEGAVRKLVDNGVESVAVSLIWSIANDRHERMLGELLRQRYPDLFVTLSSEAASFQGEYERTATTVFNAYIGPRIGAYLNDLRALLRDRGLRREPLIMQAYGGVLGVDDSVRKAVGTIESGPAAGVAACHYMGGLTGIDNIVAADMGGTTFKVGIIREAVMERDYQPIFLRYRLLSPKIWVESIGAGGGSIAWIEEETGLLKVGPRGAGASPGPVCYNRGGSEPTVTDASLILGYLNPGYFLGGQIALDVDAARRAVTEKVAAPLGMSVIEAAGAIHRIVNAQMSDLIRNATIQRGHDPRGDTLFAFGGACPVHAGRFAAELGIEQVVVPVTASVHGAVGLVASDVVYEEGVSDRSLVPVPTDRLNASFSPVLAKVRRSLEDAGFGGDDVTLARSVDMRYRYQVHEINVPIPPGEAPLTEEDLEAVYARFDELYENAYGKGSAYRAAGREIVTLRVTGSGALPKPALRPREGGGEVSAARKGTRPVYFEEFGDFVPTVLYDVARMRPGMAIAEPGVIETPITTVLINPGDRAVMDDLGNIRIAVGSRAALSRRQDDGTER